MVNPPVTSYPVTQYLIERYYESIGKPLPDSPYLPLHKTSQELFDIISGKAEPENCSSSGNNNTNSTNNRNSPDTGSRHLWDRLRFIASKTIPFVNQTNELKQESTSDSTRTIPSLREERQHAISYDQWAALSLKLDSLQGNDLWKQTEESELYDYKLIKSLTLQLKQCRISKNYRRLLYLIRSRWSRNFGQVNNVNLYRHCNIGTKLIIEEYLTESKLSLEALVSDSDNDLDPEYLLGVLQQTRRNIGKTALVLSGGATFGLFHIGVLAALFEANLMPRVISGTSAGAIVAAIYCVHTRDEIPSLLANVLNMEFNIFRDDTDTGTGTDTGTVTGESGFWVDLLIKLQRFLKDGTWFVNDHLSKTMIGFLGDMTFREAYYRTGKILNITVSPASVYEQPRLLNNLTAPNVLIWSAVCASCSLPGVFPASPLFEKDPKTGKHRLWAGNKSVKFVDGSVDNDLPITRLSEMFNVDNIIACQVNPHVFPFLKLSVACVGGEVQTEFTAKLKDNVHKAYNIISNEVSHYLEVLGELGIARNPVTKVRSVLSQRYSGDITILPDLDMLLQFYELLHNPSQTFLLYQTTCGARSTWTKLSMIKNICGQEFALDEAINTLRTRVIASASIRNSLQFAPHSTSVLTRGITSVPEDEMFIQVPRGRYPEHNDQSNQIETNNNNNVPRGALEENLFGSEAANNLLFIGSNGGADGDGNDNCSVLEAARSDFTRIRPVSVETSPLVSSHVVSINVAEAIAAAENGFSNTPLKNNRFRTSRATTVKSKMGTEGMAVATARRLQIDSKLPVAAIRGSSAHTVDFGVRTRKRRAHTVDVHSP